jgi:hypothetical protein
VVLFNAWNKLVKDGEPDAAQDAAVEELRRLVSIGRIRVWSQNFQLGFEERLWRTPGPGVGYLPWVEICKAYRGADIFLDCTPKVLELGRVEAAAAGCLILHQPTRPTSGITSLEWAPDNIREQIDLSISMDRDPERISKRAQRAFRWPDVAARVVDFIKEVL